MAYIPKSQIKTNLFTNGGELLKLSDNLPYKGYYYKTSQGNFFAGKYPGDGLNFPLILKSYQVSITTIPSSLEQQQILQERKN